MQESTSCNVYGKRRGGQNPRFVLYMKAFLNINLYVATLLILMLTSCANHDSGPADGPDQQSYLSDSMGHSVLASGVWTLDGELVGNGVLQISGNRTLTLSNVPCSALLKRVIAKGETDKAWTLAEVEDGVLSASLLPVGYTENSEYCSLSCTGHLFRLTVDGHPRVAEVTFGSENMCVLNSVAQTVAVRLNVETVRLNGSDEPELLASALHMQLVFAGEMK